MLIIYKKKLWVTAVSFRLQIYMHACLWPYHPEHAGAHQIYMHASKITWITNIFRLVLNFEWIRWISNMAKKKGIWSS